MYPMLLSVLLATSGAGQAEALPADNPLVGAWTLEKYVDTPEGGAPVFAIDARQLVLHGALPLLLHLVHGRHGRVSSSCCPVTGRRGVSVSVRELRGAPIVRQRGRVCSRLNKRRKGNAMRG